jgi:hypothetical protein
MKIHTIGIDLGKTSFHLVGPSIQPKGGMGEIHEPPNTRLGREVAVKISVERFEREARAAPGQRFYTAGSVMELGFCTGCAELSRERMRRLPATRPAPHYRHRSCVRPGGWRFAPRCEIRPEAFVESPRPAAAE